MGKATSTCRRYEAYYVLFAATPTGLDLNLLADIRRVDVGWAGVGSGNTQNMMIVIDTAVRIGMPIEGRIASTLKLRGARNWKEARDAR